MKSQVFLHWFAFVYLIGWLAVLAFLFFYWRDMAWYVSWPLSFLATMAAPNLGGALWAVVHGREPQKEL